MARNPFEFAVNRPNDTEFAGTSWSPDGQIGFGNIFGDGPRAAA